MDVLVEHDYIARDSKELTLTKGDIIKNVTKKEDGWWEGTLNSRKGIFPDKYVKPIENTTNVVLRNRSDVSRIRQCRVVFSYKQDHEDELSLKIGDIIDILGEVEEGWWRGVLNGREGVFPSNFVQEIPPQVLLKAKSVSKENLADNTSNESVTQSNYSKLGKTLCKVKYSYKAQNEDELTLKEGDLVTLISKDGQDVGWWKGELNGVVGLFPDNFVAILNSDHKAKTPEPSESASKKVTSVRKSLENDRSDDSQAQHTAKTPPLPGKKPILPIKKSPSNSGSSGGLFSGLKKKIVDVVDGTASSKNSTTPPKTEVNCENNNDFDDVVRRPLLADPRASRPKAPGRRLPSAIYKDSDIMDIPNGNDEQHNINNNNNNNAIKAETPEPDDLSPLSEVVDGNEVKPKLREWEKHKAPWLEEMKLNQLKRNSSPLDKPPPPKPAEKTIISEAEAVENKLNKSVEEKSSSVEMSRSLIVESKSNVVTPMRKATVPSPSRSQTIHNDAGFLAKKPSPIINKSPLVPVKSERKMMTASTTSAEDEIDGDVVTKQQYLELVEKIKRLEELIDKQQSYFNTAIDELKSKLELEAEIRMKLQVRIEHLLTDDDAIEN